MSRVQIFAKPPVEGYVKTRLIADLNAADATRIYRFCLQFTLDLLRASSIDYQVWLSDTSADRIFAEESCRLQQGANLGERMLHALHHGFVTYPHEPILLIGSDCLDLSERHLNQAIISLNRHDLVLLPALDGGFALIGCRNIDATLFDKVRWSSASVLQQTLNNAAKLNYRVKLLETVRDVDTLHDLNHYPQLRALISQA